MRIVYPCCAGLDVHKKTVVACVCRANEQGVVEENVKTFGTMTKHLQALSAWLTSLGVTHIAMESTGVFWKPVFHILENGHFQLLLVEEKMAPFESQLRRLDEFPGVDRWTAQNVIAEVGTDMTPFPSAGHLSSWTGICSGNNQSAGKRRSGKTPKGNRWLRRTLTQAAWAAGRTKDSYFAAQYHRLVPRRGTKRAIVAIAHSLLTTIYHLLQTGQAYQDLGPDHFDRLKPERLKRYLVRRLERLGYKVILDSAAA